MSAGGAAPTTLRFAREPAADELAVALAHGAAATRAVVVEDDERLTVLPRGPSMSWVAVFVLACTAALTALPFVRDDFGAHLPTAVDAHTLRWLAAACWAVVVPTLLALWWLSRRHAARLVPGAVVTRRTGELHLPWIDQRVPRERLVRFVVARGRRRLPGARVVRREQSGVLFRADGDDTQLVYAPFATRLGRGGGRAPAQVLADHYDLPLQRVDARWL